MRANGKAASSPWQSGSRLLSARANFLESASHRALPQHLGVLAGFTGRNLTNHLHMLIRMPLRDARVTVEVELTLQVEPSGDLLRPREVGGAQRLLDRATVPQDLSENQFDDAR